MIWSKARFQHSIELFPRVLKESALILFPLSLILWSLEFYVSWLNKARFADPYGTSMGWIITVGLVGVILQSLVAVFWLLFVAASTRRHSQNGAGDHPLKFVNRHYHQCLIEAVRALISTGIYTLFFIIPGIYRWVQLSFTTLFSAFDDHYKQGNKDALKGSSGLAGGAILPLLFLLGLQALIPMSCEEMAKSGGYGWLGVLLGYGCSWLVSLYLTIYFSLTFFARHSFKQEPS
jgi:hypothetical protein